MALDAPIAERGIWVYLEHDEGRPLSASLELLGKARELADTCGDPLTAIVLSKDGGDLARQAILQGADAAVVGDHPLLDPFTTEVHTKAMAQLVEARRPNVLLVAATPHGRDLAGRLAVRLKTGLTANATRLEIDPTTRVLLSAVPGFGGSVLAIIKNERARPQISTVRAGVFRPLPPDPTRTGPIEPVDIQLTKSDVGCVVLRRVHKSTVDLAGAPRVLVAGLGASRDMPGLERLAALMDAQFGVTRPLVDLGLATRERQVGSTGIGLRGKVALVAGASGASHFTSGLKDVKTVVAVNLDPKAEIFEHADVCVVADWDELLPLLLAELEAQRKVLTA